MWLFVTAATAMPAGAVPGDPVEPGPKSSRSFPAGVTGPAGALVPSSPAAMPATCVPWKDAARSTGSFPGLPEPGPGKERATITFGVVYDVSPRGKPVGYV